MAENEYEEFLKEYSEVITELAEAGWTATEAFARLSILFPGISADLLSTALEREQWLFVRRREQPLNNMMMAAALWYAVSWTLDLEPEPRYAAVHLDAPILQDIPRMLEASGVDARNTAHVMGRIGAALKYLAEQPYTSLEEASYDELLEFLPQEVHGISDGVTSWPPERFMVEDRLGDGSWSTALLRVGICAPDIDELGYQVSGSTLTDRAFRNALGDYLSYCIRYDRKPTVLLYGAWSTAGHHMGKVPLLGAIRNKYGTWAKALFNGRRLVNDALKMSVSSAMPVSVPFEAPVPSRLEDFSAHGIAVVQANSISPEELYRQQWSDLNSVMYTQFSALPWGTSLRVYYTDTPEALGDEPLTPYVRILRSAAGYLCELTSLDDFENNTPVFNTEYLVAKGWSLPRDNYRVWSQNFFDVPDAAYSVVGAMRDGMGCTNRYGYFYEGAVTEHPQDIQAIPLLDSQPDSRTDQQPNPVE